MIYIYERKKGKPKTKHTWNMNVNVNVAVFNIKTMITGFNNIINSDRDKKKIIE